MTGGRNKDEGEFKANTHIERVQNCGRIARAAKSR